MTTTLILIIILIAGIASLPWAINSMLKHMRAEYILKTAGDQRAAITDWLKVHPMIHSWPQWAKEEYKNIVAEVTTMQEKLDDELKHLNDDEVSISKVDGPLKTLGQKYENISTTLEAYKYEVYILINRARKRLEEAGVEILSAQKVGIAVLTYEQSLSEMREIIDRLESGENADDKMVCDMLEQQIKKIDELAAVVGQTHRDRNKAMKALSDIPEKLKDVQDRIPETETALELLADYPEVLWKTEADNFARVSELVAKVYQTIADVAKFTAMENQQLGMAVVLAGQAEADILEAKKYVALVHEKLADIKQAEIGFKYLQNDVAQAVQTALNQGKTLLAKQLLDEALNLSTADKINWITALNKLLEAETVARKSCE